MGFGTGSEPDFSDVETWDGEERGAGERSERFMLD